MISVVRNCYVLFVAVLFYGCNSDSEGRWENPLSSAEIITLRNMVDQIDSEQIDVYYEKIRKLSHQSLPLSAPESIQSLEEYKDVYNWIKNDIKNFPLLFHYIIYDEKNNVEYEASTAPNSSLWIYEDMDNTGMLLWDLADEFYPSITNEMRQNNDFSSVSLIKKLLSYTD
jgi:hypothetical protein